ncbi:MAG: hypothetical protein R3E89_00955 [Thiolinea sp.]
MQTASYAYLHKPARALSHAEAALLAVLPQAPSYLRVRTGTRNVLKVTVTRCSSRMETLGIWDQQTVQDARMESVFESGFRQPMTAPLFAQRLRNDQRYQERPRINTALDPDFAVDGGEYHQFAAGDAG